MQAVEQADGSVRVTLASGESLTIGEDESAYTVTGPVSFTQQPIPGLPLQVALAKAGVEIAVAAIAVPDSCTKLGLKRVLAETGQNAVFSQPEWPAVKAAIASDADRQEDWDLAVEIRRSDPLVQAVIAARGYDAVTVDKILMRAKTLAG